MRNELSALTIKRTSKCHLAGEPSIHFQLLSRKCPIMEYFASSVADSIRYEEETIRTLHDSNCEIPITIEDLSGCSRCERRDKCLISILD
jgi:hypothetical protein